MIIVYSDKMTLSKRILPIIKPYYPYEEVIGIYPMHFGNRFHYIHFNYEQHIDSLPFIGEQDYIIPSHSDIPAFHIDNSGNFADIRINAEQLENYSLIYAGDPHYRDLWYFNLFLEKVLHSTIYEQHIDALTLYSLDQPSIIDSFNKKQNLADIFSKHIDIGEVRSYFDYLFNINSTYFFKPIFQHLGIESDIVMSKYMLQLLYFIDTMKNEYTEGKLVSVLSKWKGSGNYTNEIYGMGSPSSYSGIIENLKSLELIESTPYYHIELFSKRNVPSERVLHKIQISNKGKALLQSLPPQMQDSDLPFKIALWSEQEVVHAKKDIDSYIHHFFSP